MAEGIRISQLPSITALTDDDTLIINDGNSATSRITYANFRAAISETIAGVSSVNGQSGEVTIDATTLGVYTVQQVNDLVDTKASNALIGVVNGSADLGSFAGSTIPANVTVRAALQSLETAVESGDAQDAILTGDNTFTGENTFQGKITGAMTGNVIPFYFDSQVQFPSAAAAHGAVAHSHADGKMYFAHGGAWVELANAAGALDPANYYTAAEVDAELAGKLDNAGGSVTGPLDAQSGLNVSGQNSDGSSLSVTGVVRASSAQLGTDLDTLPIPFIASNDQDVTTKKYVDDAITAAGGVDLSGYYTSSEVDAALTNYYTSSQIDVTLGSYYTSAQVDLTFYNRTQVDDALALKADAADLADYSTTIESDAAYATAAQGALADTALQDGSLYATAEQGTKADSALQDASAFATAEQGTKADSALQDASAFATAAQGTAADNALQPGDVGVSVQGYDANTVIDSNYATVQSGAAAGATALQAETIDMTAFKAVVAASSDFADFQTRVAAL